MSQEHDPITTTTTIRKQRRTRQRRKHPVLITTTESENALPQTDELVLDADSEQEAEATTAAESASATKARPLSRLPKFFSRVDKSEQKEDDVAKARLARANHDKADRGSKASIVKANTKNDTKPQSKREPLFKIRHFVGMTVYLFGAQLILPYEAFLLDRLGLNHPYPVTIFNFTIPLSSALFFNIATLIVFLYILVKLDLLPNTASARIRAQQKAQEQQSQDGQNAAPAVKNVPPPMKLGIKGQDDDLYRAYRTNQRREKKR
jgi:hypothetical protein